MTKTKWLIIGAVAVTLGLMTGGAVLIWCFVSQDGHPELYGLTVYTTEQIPSAHPGYRRTLLTSGDKVYVNDYEEYSLRLFDIDPKTVVGRSPFGGGKICSIPGQPTNAYLAADCGSEMPSYEVFRNTQSPPFDWRHATFQRMQLAMLLGPAANKQTTDPALIQDVLRTLIDGTPTTAPSALVTNTQEVHLFSDQLPGMIFSPSIYIDPTGNIYLAENYTVVDYRALKVQARWIPASPLFTKWAQTR
jgi:hypothetical protein